MVVEFNMNHKLLFNELCDALFLIFNFSGSDAGQDGPSIDHFDFGLITPKLAHLEELHMTYG